MHGIKRRSSSFNTYRINHIYQDPHDDDCSFKLHYGDLTDSTNIIKIVKETQPDEIYNLGAQSHVSVSFKQPEYTANCDGLGILRILEAVRLLNLEKKPKYIKPVLANYMDLFRKCLKPKKHLFIQEVPMQ